MSVPGAIAAAITLVVSGGNVPLAIFAYNVVAGLTADPVRGPRLDDLRVQSSEYGRPIPITYGTVALGGNVIWASDLVPVEHEDGGKGGPGVVNTSYFANFAVAICEGEVSLGRIWAGFDKRLIWDGGTLEGAESGAQLRFYPGSEDQLPDPLIESYMGVGNVPAYRGTAYLVLENFPVEKDGNHLPFLTVEVGAVTEAPQPLGYVWPYRAFYDESRLIVHHGPGAGGRIVQGTDSAHTWYSGVAYAIGTTSQSVAYDADRNQLVLFSGPSGRFTVIPDETGEEQYFTIDRTGFPAGTAIYNGGVLYHGGKYLFGLYPVGSVLAAIVVVNPDTFETETVYTYSTPDNLLTYMAAPADPTANYLIGLSNTAIMKFPLVSGAPAVDLGTFPYESIYSKPFFGVDESTGYVYVVKSVNTASSSFSYSVHDPATETKILEQTITTQTFKPAGLIFIPYALSGGDVHLMCYGQSVGDSSLNRWDHYIVFNPDGTIFEEVDGAPISLALSGDANIAAMVYDSDRQRLLAFRNSYGGALVGEGDPNGDPATIPLQTWVIGTYTGSAAPRSAVLSDVVADLSARAGLPADQIDVTALADDTVYGYAIANQMDIKSAIDALRPVYFFDAVESGGLIKFVKRGGTTVTPIDDDELGAYESGSEPVDDLETTRIMDEELPRIVTVRYLLEATKYDTATKIAKRLVGNSGSEASMDLPLVLTDTKAQEVAEVNLHGPWVGRLTYRFSVPRKYGFLEPTDIVAVKGYTMRIVTIKQTDGRYQVEAVHDDSNVYTPNVVVYETPPPPGEVVETLSDTLLELM
jgi:hypothetical protein